MFPFNQGRVKLNKDERRHKSSPLFIPVWFLFILFTLRLPSPFQVSFHSSSSAVHTRIPAAEGGGRRVSGCLARQTTGSFDWGMFFFAVPQWERTRGWVCSRVVKQNNKPLSCHVKWSGINRLSIRSTYKCALSTPTHYIEWTLINGNDFL